MKLSLHGERWDAITPFRITGHTFEAFESLVVEVADGGCSGRGEALGVYYLDESVASMAAQVESIAARLEAGIDRADLQSLLPPGGARNALDCALWDLESKRAGRRAWELAGIEPRPLETVFTIGLEATPEAMAAKAAAAQAHGLLKVKLDGAMPLERMQAIRRARPDARIVVDANQGWTFAQLRTLAPAFADLGVQMIEQPLPRGADEPLEGYRTPLPLCADESCLHLGELARAARRYQMINIKLDKTGGLTEALALRDLAHAQGYGIMVGCMVGSSLAMAPAVLVAQGAEVVDLDGPLLLAEDRPHPLRVEGSTVHPPEAILWG